MKRVKRFITVFVGIVFLFSPKASWAKTLNLLPQDDSTFEETLSQEIKKKLKRGTFFLLGIEEKLLRSREELKLLRDNMKTLGEKIETSKTDVTKLESQVKNLDNLILQHQEKIRAATLLTAEMENTIAIGIQEIQKREKTLKTHIQSLEQSVFAYYLQNNVFFGTYKPEASLLAFLASETSTGDILKENGYLFYLQELSQKLAKEIIRTQGKLDEENLDLKQKQEKLKELRMFLEREKRNLLASKESKYRLLEETKGKQIIYETLLDLSQKEVEQVFVQIQRLKENYDFFQTKLEELQKNPSAFPLKLSEDEKENYEPLLQGETILAWPVAPSLGLSALFHDSAYEAALGVQHNAIDIRIVQGSKVKAAADGIVTKVADNGFAYSYIIIAHAGNLLTLYGHMSDIIVSEGEIVRQGQTIGLSGGIPGTKGAGWLTTGAHLHLEVFKNWQHADPLEYLPLEYVPVASLPEKYFKKLAGEEEKVKRK